MRREIGRILPPLRGRGEGDSEKEAGEGRLVGWREQNQDQGNKEIRAGKACLVAEQLCTIDDGLSFLVLVFLPVLPGTEKVCFSCLLFSTAGTNSTTSATSVTSSASTSAKSCLSTN